MKFKIKQNILFEHLTYVIRGISSKNLIPILNCIKFDLLDEGLYLTSSDNELSIKTFIKQKDIESIERLGSLVVSGRFIYDIVRKLDNEIINLEEIIDSQVLITTSKSSFKLNCNNVSEYPNINLELGKNPISLSQQTFKTTIHQTIFATSNQESRPVLTGINFKIKNNLLQCTATDSYRLAKKTIELTNPVEEDIDIIVPARNLLEVIRMLNPEDKNIDIHIFSNKIIFNFDNIIVMSRLINGTYPDTNKLLPTDFKLKVKFKLDDLYGAIDRASLLTNEEEKNIIKLETKGNLAILSSNIPEIGNVEEQLEIEKNIEDEIKIAFSSKFMLDAIKIFDSVSVELKFNSEIKPIIITDGTNDNLIQLILPIRTY